MGSLVYYAVYVFGAFSFLCALYITISSLRKKRYLWTSYSVLSLFVVISIFVPDLPEMYRVGMYLGDVIFAVCFISFVYVASVDRATPFIIIGIIGLASFAAHLFLLHNIP